MEGFLDSFNLFGMGLLLLVPLIVQGTKTFYQRYTGEEMPPKGAMLTVVGWCWFLLGLHALVAYVPGSTDAVKYVIAAILLPVASMGAYDVAKTVAGK